MKEFPKVFISFSSRDRIFARKLFYSLKSQGIDVWDYSQRGEEIPLANAITEYLEKQIDASDYFIAVASASSTDKDIGRFTHHEVAVAVRKGMLGGSRIIPVVLSTNPPVSWSGAFEALQGLTHLEVDPQQPKLHEEAVEKICRRLGVRYTPPYLGDLRLPFSERFMKEVRELNLPIALYGELMLIVDDFTRKFAAGDWLESERLISYFQMMAQYKLPNLKMYYPEIIKGVCELQMGRFRDAEETFLQATRHSRPDENAFGGLGQVYFRQHRYEEALAAYQRARKMCPKGKDLEVRVNILATQVQMGLKVDDPAVLDEVDWDNQAPDDWVNMMNLKGILRFKKGDYEPAVQVFEEMRRRGLYDATSAVYHCLALKEERRYEEAIDILRTEAERSEDPSLYHHLADLCVSRGRMSEALDIYRNKLCRNQTTRPYMVEYARVLKTMGDRKAFKEICEKVLRRDFFKPPSTSEDFYYDGFANYLLGRHDRARYDYERSAGFFETYYDELGA